MGGHRLPHHPLLRRGLGLEIAACVGEAGGVQGEVQDTGLGDVLDHDQRIQSRYDDQCFSREIFEFHVAYQSGV